MLTKFLVRTLKCTESLVFLFFANEKKKIPSKVGYFLKKFPLLLKWLKTAITFYEISLYYLSRATLGSKSVIMLSHTQQTLSCILIGLIQTRSWQARVSLT
jgi:hypothetical protein